jgi:uncharacterized protein (TIGR01732 family)
MGNGFALIVVLFTLLIIVRASGYNTDGYGCGGFGDTGGYGGGW